eukprot:scaffold19.g1760.t1
MHVPALSGKRIVLGSASPRRKELLQLLGLRFEVVVSSFEETLPKEQFTPAEYAVATASHKALDIARALAAAAEAAAAAGSRAATEQQHVPADLVITADTVVEHAGQILEKPADAEDARAMLSMLSGSRHLVHTGVALALPPAAAQAASAAPGGSSDAEAVEAAVPGQGERAWHTGEPRIRSFAVTTAVEFEELSPATIEAYIDSGEPFGKAGAYGIQGKAGCFVRSIEGCFYNVCGVDLSGRPAYNQRHRVCDVHTTQPVVELEGVGEMRSCRAKLQRHAALRRAARLEGRMKRKASGEVGPAARHKPSAERDEGKHKCGGSWGPADGSHASGDGSDSGAAAAPADPAADFISLLPLAGLSAGLGAPARLPGQLAGLQALLSAATGPPAVGPAAPRPPQLGGTGSAWSAPPPLPAPGAGILPASVAPAMLGLALPRPPASAFAPVPRQQAESSSSGGNGSNLLAALQALLQPVLSRLATDVTATRDVALLQALLPVLSQLQMLLCKLPQPPPPPPPPPAQPQLPGLPALPPAMLAALVNAAAGNAAAGAPAADPLFAQAPELGSLSLSALMARAAAILPDERAGGPAGAAPPANGGSVEDEAAFLRQVFHMVDPRVGNPARPQAPPPQQPQQPQQQQQQQQPQQEQPKPLEGAANDGALEGLAAVKMEAQETLLPAQPSQEAAATVLAALLHGDARGQAPAAALPT